MLFSCRHAGSAQRAASLTGESRGDFFVTSQPLSSFSLSYSQVRQAASAQPHPQQRRFSLHYQSVYMSPLAGQSVLSAVHPVLSRRECGGMQSSFPTCIRRESGENCVSRIWWKVSPGWFYHFNTGRYFLIYCVSKENFSRFTSNMGIIYNIYIISNEA